MAKRITVNELEPGDMVVNTRFNYLELTLSSYGDTGEYGEELIVIVMLIHGKIHTFEYHAADEVKLRNSDIHIPYQGVHT